MNAQKTVLLVDDDNEILESMRTVLEARGYRVILDEAQDTDADMFAILTEITRPDGAPPGTWPVQEDAPGPVPGASHCERPELCST